MDSTFVTVNGYSVRYLEQGEGPPLVVLHGLGFHNSADNWRGLVSALCDEFRVIAVDMVGWGWSDRPPDGCTFPMMISVVREFLCALDLPVVNLMGFTLGGWVASLLTIESPEFVDKLVLVQTAGLNKTSPYNPDSFVLPTAAEIRAHLEGIYRGAIEVTEAMIEDEQKKQARSGTAEAYRNVLRYVNDPLVRQEWSLEHRLGQVSRPTLVVWENDDARVLGPERGARAVEGLPDAQGVGVERAYSPGELAPPLRTFLRS